MKKSTVRWWVVLATVLGVYNVIVFAAPFPKNAVFFLSWAFTMLSIAVQIYVIRTAFFHGREVKSKFYGFPIARLGVIYLTVQLVLGLVFMALGFAVTVPVWVPLIVYVVALGVAAIGFVSADAVKDEIERQDVELKKDISCMRSL